MYLLVNTGQFYVFQINESRLNNIIMEKFRKRAPNVGRDTTKALLETLNSGTKVVPGNKEFLRSSLGFNLTDREEFHAWFVFLVAFNPSPPLEAVCFTRLTRFTPKNSVIKRYRNSYRFWTFFIIAINIGNALFMPLKV